MKRTLPLSKRGMNFETIMWFFTRLSALAIYGLLLVGLVGALYMGARTQMNFAEVMRWAFMPTTAHVESTELQDLSAWAHPFWKLTASALLLVATAHGVHGLVVICDDYLVKPWQRQLVRYISMVCMAATSFMGLYIIWL